MKKKTSASLEKEAYGALENFHQLAKNMGMEGAAETAEDGLSALSQFRQAVERETLEHLYRLVLRQQAYHERIFNSESPVYAQEAFGEVLIIIEQEQQKLSAPAGEKKEAE